MEQATLDAFRRYGETQESVNADEQERFMQDFRKRLSERQESRTVRGVDPREFTSEDSLAALQLFADSAAFGWAEEFGLALAAGTISIATGEEAGEVMTSLKERYDARQEALREDFPAVAATAEVAGAVASPVNLVSGPAAVTSRLSQLSGVGGTAARTGAMAGRGAVEGAIYEAGKSDPGERLAGAGEGLESGFAGAVAAKSLFGAGSAAINAVTKRRIEDDLVDEFGNFLPIHMANLNEGDLYQSGIKQFYRDVVAPSFGAKGVISGQEKLVVDSAEALSDGNKALMARLKASSKSVEKSFNDDIKASNKAFDEKIKGVSPDDFQARINALKDGGAEQKRIIKRAVDGVQKSIDAQRYTFRQQALIESVPRGATVEDIAALSKITDPQEKMSALARLWQAKGFSAIHNNDFKISKLEIEDGMRKAFRGEAIPNIDATVAQVMKTFDDVMFDEGGDVAQEVFKGDRVARLRSILGGKAADAVDDPERFRALRQAQKTIDDILERQLPKDQVAAWAADKAAWKTTVVLRDATRKSIINPRNQGAFTEDDWLKSINANSKNDALFGSGPLNREAVGLRKGISALERKAAKQGAAAAKRQSLKVEAEIANQAQKTRRKIESLEAQKAKAESRMRTDGAGKVAAIRQELDAATAEFQRSKSMLDRLKELRSPKNPSWFHTMAATGILTALAGPGGAGLAVGGARLLASEGAQRALAGQTGWQQGAQKILQDDRTGVVSDILQRQVGRAGMAGMLTSNR